MILPQTHPWSLFGAVAFTSLESLVSGLERRPQWRSHQTFQQILACWPQVVGDVVALQTRPLCMQRHVLVVSTSTPVWSQNLAFQRQHILGKLSDVVPDHNLKDIRFSPAKWSDLQASSAKGGRSLQRYHFEQSEAHALWTYHPCQLSGHRAGRRAGQRVEQGPELEPEAKPGLEPKLESGQWPEPKSARSPQPKILNPNPPLSYAGSPRPQETQLNGIPPRRTKPMHHDGVSGKSHDPIDNPLDGTPAQTFHDWAATIQKRSQQLPKCPRCQSPTPIGELQRWSVCSLCITKEWGPLPPSPEQPPHSKPIT